MNEDKFPFKWMQKIVGTFSVSNKPLTAFQLARKIGSCSSDAGEVAKMLVFLTQKGRVVNNDEKWKIEYISVNHNPHPTGFRTNHIRELIVLLENLSENFVRLEDLSLITKRSESDISHDLSFLNSITNNGYLYLHKKHLLKQWSFRSWETKQ